MQAMIELLKELYGNQANMIFEKIRKLMNQYKSKSEKKDWVDQKDVILITYGDSIKEKGYHPLSTLDKFLTQYVKDTITNVHLLPFYPYSSDDGFSVIDYKKVNPNLGDWADIDKLGNKYNLMFDAVINHISSESSWFQSYLKGKEKYKQYFIDVDPELDYSSVVRPRALPLYTKFDTEYGEKYVWTTFSKDQIDLNYKNPEVLLDILDVLLFYTSKGARWIRMDAVGFLWKEVGTTCIHLKQTHLLVKLFRMVLDEVSPGTIIITETNVPHKENISYFGNGYDEAQLVYQFPLPPLTLFSFITQDTSKLLKWLSSIESNKDNTTYFNFLASHDGIGLRPVEGILSRKEVEMMVERTFTNGGKVSYRYTSDGKKSPYELNINYMEAMKDFNENEDSLVKKFIASQAVLLSLAGVPGIYIHSLLGSKNWNEGVEKYGENRKINREKLNYDSLLNELSDAENITNKVFSRYLQLLQIRINEPAFSPSADQKVLFLDRRIFSIKRRNEIEDSTIIVLINVSSEQVDLPLNKSGINIIDSRKMQGVVKIEPYEVIWLKLDK